MVTFTRIPTVAVGDPVTSTEMIALADGINDRIKSGFGDATRRIHFYLSAPFRQIRNSSGTLFPPVDEFRAIYEHIPPNEYTWPLTGPGEEEGTNVSSIAGAFVFGNEILNVKSEDERLTNPEEGGVDLDFGTGSAFELWELAKRQRGAIAPESLVVASPVFDAAKSHFGIIQNARSQHGNAYGGYIPTPEFLSSCPNPAEDGIFQIIFTPLIDGLPTLTFEGFCESEPTHVATILRYPNDRYIVVQNDGTLTQLDWNEYIEGPYEFGNRLAKTWGNNLNRILNFFSAEFSGTPTQKASEDDGSSDWLSHAFTTQEFLTTQYHLAPQRGLQTGEYVQPLYPQWKATNSTTIPSGTTLNLSGSTGTTFASASGFVTASVLVHSSQLLGSVSVSVLDGTTTLGTVTLDASNPSRVLTFTARSVTALQFVTTTNAQFSASSSTAGLFCEATELWEYKPALWDLSLLLRLCGARMSLENGTDGSGLDEDQAKEIGDDYFANGVIVNRRLHIALPGSFAEINTNAVFDAARRMNRQWSRLVPREQLIGYEVGADGKSVLYFRRLWSGMDSADVFDGIAPDKTPAVSGELQEGREYVVADGVVNYKGTNYAIGSTFTVSSDDLTFSTAAGKVYQANGILPDALPGGWSNEWVMDVLSLIPYQTLDTSIWKTDAFTDYVSWTFDRCTWQAPTPLPTDLTWHFSYGNADWVAPESLPTFRYVGSDTTAGINYLPCAALDTACEAERRKKLRSCPIGELPLVVEKTERLWENGEEVVKVTLNGRLQHGTDAPATVDRDYTTWSLATIAAENESGRTQENGIREYLINQFVGGNCTGPGTQYGNAAHESTVATSLDVPFGACYPRIGFTRLIPKPYEDGNTSDDPHDTPMESWPFTMMETYARAMCEGYVDTVSTEQYGCQTGTYAVLDYTFENACFSAFGGRSFGVLPSVTTTYATAADIRADKPLFHGPLPNTEPTAEIFNQFAAFFNQLDAIRLILPIDFQTKYGLSETVEVKKLYQADAIEIGCSTGSAVNPGVYNTFSPVMPATPTLGSYAAAALSSASYTMTIDPDACDGSGDWRLVHSRRDEQFKWALLHDDFLEAIPESWRDMIETNGLLLGTRETQTSWNGVTMTTVGLGTECNHPAADVDFWSGGGGEIVKFIEHTEYVSECKLLPYSERLTPPLPSPSAIGVGREFNAGTLYDCPINATGTLTVTPIPADALIIRADLV